MKIRKTHYEEARDFLKSHCSSLFPEEILSLGPNPNYDDFYIAFLKSEGISVGSPEIVNTVNVLYHMYHLNKTGEKIYYLTSDLTARLASTSINVDSHFLKCPFSEIYVQIEPGLFYINDYDMKKVSVDGFYINYRESGNSKIFRIMASSLLKPTSQIPFNDTHCYFKIEIEPGSIKSQIKNFCKYNLDPYKKYDSLKKFIPHDNIDYIEEFAFFVFNTLLYITSYKGDLIIKEPPDVGKRLKEIKSNKALKKFEKRISKTSLQRIIILGSSIKDKDNSFNSIQRANGIGTWKLKNKVRVSGYWRTQKYGSLKDNTQHTKIIWIDDYEKGPEFADVINSKYIVK